MALQPAGISQPDSLAAVMAAGPAMPAGQPATLRVAMPAGAPRLSVLVTSLLAGWLKHAGPLFAPRVASAFLRREGREREVFLPFFYQWFDERQWAQDNALRLLRVAVDREGLVPPRVFHAPFIGNRGYPLGYRRNLADPARLAVNARMLRRECAFLGRVRAEFGVMAPLVYVIHLGQRAGTSVAEAIRTAVEALRPSLEIARAAGVILAIENVADRLRDQTHAGSRLTEVEDALGALGGGEQPEAPVGWTFDLAHALLSHGGDADDVSRHATRMLPALVHLHVNAPRLHLTERDWADRHEAPTEDDGVLWELFRLACGAPRFQRIRTVTYEVNWGLHGLRWLCGGSPLRDVIRGYALVRDAASRAFQQLDERSSILETPDAVGSAEPWNILSPRDVLTHSGPPASLGGALQAGTPAIGS